MFEKFEKLLMKEIKSRLPALIKKDPKFFAEILFSVLRQLSGEELQQYEAELKKLHRIGMGDDWAYLQQIIEKEKKK
ncbi:MAG: hypothetical protein HY445_02270 [Candidatus Niyogibacteria bacterium]|nr:hypothetical protein [Candidatus Niyogibacteria bacterium]